VVLEGQPGTVVAGVDHIGSVGEAEFVERVEQPADLGVDVTPRLKTLKVSEPPKRGAGVKVPDVATLVDKLKNDAKVI